MLTRQGWAVTIGAVALLAGGRLFGLVELFVFGVAAIGLVLVAAVHVALTRLRLAVRRDVSPPRVHAGSPSRVELALTNEGTRPTPVLRLFDAVTGTRGAELLVGPLSAGLGARAAYRLPTDHRGIVAIGPLEVVVGDPFGLARATASAAPRTELTVYPRVDAIVPVPHTSGDDPMSGAEHPSALGRSGEDFYALRPYVVGDDLRRVHWPSTAKRDELMVRQDELPWQGRVTVLLDVRRSTHTAESLELVVSAAASVATASWARRDLVRLMTTDGTDFGFAAGNAHIEAMMEHLATVAAAGGGSLRGALEALSIGGAGGALVAVVAGCADSELAGLSRVRGRFGSVTIVRFDRSAYDSGAPVGAGAGASGVLVVSRGTTFADVWNQRFHPRAATTGWRAPVLTGVDPGR